MGRYRRTACPATDDIARRAPSGLTARTTATRLPPCRSGVESASKAVPCQACQFKQ